MGRYWGERKGGRGSSGALVWKKAYALRCWVPTTFRLWSLSFKPNQDLRHWRKLSVEKSSRLPMSARQSPEETQPSEIQ